METQQQNTTPQNPASKNNTETKPKRKARSASAPRRKKTPDSWLKRHSMGVMITSLSAVAICLGILLFALVPHTGAPEGGDWVYIPRGSDNKAVKDSLRSTLGTSMGLRVYMMWKLMGGDADKAKGAYMVDNGMTALTASRRLATGRQTPVNISFRGPRKLDMLARRIASQLDITPEEFLEACGRVLPEAGFKPAQFPAAFIPDTYQFYWSWPADKVVERLLEARNNFWTEERQAKARALGLSKVDVATVASIVEEETAKADERPVIAGLYLNRLRKNMRLQADPTVKFAVGDFSLRRIRGEHLKVNSPYNTYLHAGLPPGPIRVPEGRTLDAVLDSPRHDYLYMCAREDFSGYHNFASDYATHQANARRYQAELNRRNIK